MSCESIYLLSLAIQTANAPVAAPTMVLTNAVCWVVAVGPSDINHSQTFQAITVNATIINLGISFQANTLSITKVMWGPLLKIYEPKVPEVRTP